jgi:23S rRNA pseudouridine2605 synthase
MNDQTHAEGSEVRPGQRIAKVMARAGVCSRRDAEAWIAEGRVSVNGEVLKSPAFNVSETDNVRVDGKPLAAPERTRLFLFHKPRGLVTTARDPEGRATVFAALPPDLPRLVTIGRLDINTEGLLLLTNDGGLARVLELPSTGWLRRYRVRAHGTIDQAALDRLAEGVTIDGVDYLGVEAKLDREQGANAWLTLGLREGKNREIKKILEHLGLEVNRLIRVSFGPFELGDLAEAEVAEVRARVLRDQLGAKLAKEAGVDFDASLIVAEAPPPEPAQGERPRGGRGPRENQRPSREMQGRPGRGGSGGKSRSEQDGPARRAPPAPSTPERRRKHVSALRAEIAADAATTRKRIDRSATHDRKGRTIAVERVSRPRDEAASPSAPEAPPKLTGRPNSGERSGRAFRSGPPPGKTDSFGPKRGRAAGGHERPPYAGKKETGHRPERANAGRGEGGPPERRFDRPDAKRDGDRRQRFSPARGADGPGRERKFERPKGPPRDRANDSRPPRSDATNRGPRSEFKSPHAGTRDGDRRERPSPARGADGPARERKFDRPKGPPRDRANDSRPPRSDAANRGPRSEFKSRPPREGGRDRDRPETANRDPGGKGGPPRGRSSPGRFPQPPGKGPPRGAGGSRPPRKR